MNALMSMKKHQILCCGFQNHQISIKINTTKRFRWVCLDGAFYNIIKTQNEEKSFGGIVRAKRDEAVCAQGKNTSQGRFMLMSQCQLYVGLQHD